MVPSNVLFIAEGQIGDLLLLGPSLRAMKETFPSSRLSVLMAERRSIDDVAGAGPAVLTIDRGTGPLATNDEVDEIFRVDRKKLRSLTPAKRLGQEAAVVRFLRKKKFDTVVCTFPEDRFVVWAFLSGAGVRVGQKRQPLRFLLTHTPSIEKSEHGVLEYYCGLARETGAQVRSKDTRYAVSALANRWADEFLKSHNVSGDLVAIHPGATGDYKIWPPERFAGLIDSICKDRGVTPLLCYSQLDRAVVDRILECVKTHVVPVETGGDLQRLGSLLKRCILCISNDSGPRHLAVAVGVPSLAIFRRHHDREWKVYPESATTVTIQSSAECPGCPPGVCYDRKPDGERFGCHCIRAVEVADVSGRVEGMLKRGGVS